MGLYVLAELVAPPLSPVVIAAFTSATMLMSPRR